MKTDLVLTFTSPDRPGIVEDLTKTVVEHGGNWEESRLARLCGDFAGIARVSVDSEHVDALTSSLGSLSSKELIVHVKPTVESSKSIASLVDLVCTGADHEGIVSGLSGHLAKLGINVEEMETSVVAAPTTGTPLFNMNCKIQLPEDCNAETLRSELDALERELAVEIILED